MVAGGIMEPVASMRVMVWVALVVATSCMSCMSSVYAQDVLAVDFALIPADADTTALAVPKGCTCQSSESPCTQFDCTCVCDLTAGACDANCCCDSECSSDEIARFEAANACVAEGPVATALTYCADLTKEALFGSINPKFRMIKDEEDSVADDLMCIAVDNNPSKGSFFDDPGTGSTSLLASTTKPPSFESQARVVSVSTSTVYDVGDTVGAALDSSGTLLSMGGVMYIPQAGGNGACFDSNAVHFTEDVAASSCVRVLSGTSAERCASLDMANYITNLRIAKAPNAQTSDSSTFVDVTISKVVYHFTNGTELNIDEKSYSAVATGDACEFALLGVAYTISENGDGQVSAASAVVTLGDASMAGTFTTLSQTWSLAWASSASVTTSYDLGNVVARAMSGNPGYVTGKPVLAGVKVVEEETEKEAVQTWVNGLGLKRCDGATLEYVEYGTSMTFGCALTLTAAELETMCTSKSQLSMLGTDATHVGSFGNADPLRIGDWIAISKEDSSALATVWQSSSRSCTGIAVGLNMQFLTAPVGEETNPQDKILFAYVSYARDTWTYTSRTDSQTFVLSTTVSFVPKDTTQVTEYVPPPPPVLPELPNDLFYPFTLGLDSDEVNSAPTTATNFAATLLLLAFVSIATAASGVVTE